ncbi:hypothetical protein LFT44_21405 (plasmid) [Arthrobacter sp. FW306-05-C]|uniref:hypothetical protein n=1 Tax=unclassified Arthrobacter TaxID=235627 RepID=UPI001EF15D80|nr:MULTISPECIES: hypothetical protein [unclassified Arthrobacter]UKA69081.1 hypothetical protein LFT44_21405 [Arthrobacter sp. FW306-05-C]UKA70910.1 hypothetical protein LFT49_19685 [Arthrobacter sp. FW306-06-A]
MTNTAKDETEERVKEAAVTGNALGLSASQVIAGGAAAAVASIIGGHLGLTGTVVGAFIFSVISAVALPLFRASLEKSHAQLKRVMPRRGTGAVRTTPPQSVPRTVRATSGKVSAAQLLPDRALGTLAGVQHAPGKSPRVPKARSAVGGTALIFLVGLGSILGFQSATGLALSEGTGALQSGVSMVVSDATENKVAPPSDPTPNAPTEESGTVPLDSATEPAEQPTPTPTRTSHPDPSAKPTAPVSTNAPAPPSLPRPLVTSSTVPTR